MSLVVQDPQQAPPCLQAFDPAVLCLVHHLLSLHMIGVFSSFAPLLLSFPIISFRDCVTSELLFVHLFIYLSVISHS